MSLRREAGFTLIEIMLVMVLLAMSSVAVIMTMPNNKKDEVKEEATRFYQLTQLLNEEAVLTGRDYGIQVLPHRYFFVELTQDGWGKLTTKTKYYNEVELPNDITLEVKQGGVWSESGDRLFEKDDLFTNDDLFENQAEEKKKPPQIVVMASGEITPFTVSFETSGEHQYWRVNGSEEGVLSLLAPHQSLEKEK